MNTTKPHRPLTGRERVTRAFKRKDIDRIPRYDSYWSDTILRWEGEGLVGGTGAILAELDSDVQHVGWAFHPPLDGEDVVLSEDEETRLVMDRFGGTLRWWKRKSGTPEHLGFECTDPDIWRSKYLPGFNRTPEIGNWPDLRRSYAEARKAGRYVTMAGVEAWEYLRRLVGDEGMAVALAEDPDWIREMAEAITGFVLSYFQQLIDGGIAADALFIYGDMAYTAAPFCSPQMYRETIWPTHKRMAGWAHERGLEFIYHTDGDIRSLMDPFIDAGFDAIQPLEAKANVDVRELAPRYGDKVILFGNINAIVLASGDMDRIEHEIATKFSAGMEARAYFYHSDHSIPPDVSLEDYRKIIRLIDKHGWY